MILTESEDRLPFQEPTPWTPQGNRPERQKFPLMFVPEHEFDGLAPYRSMISGGREHISGSREGEGLDEPPALAAASVDLPALVSALP